MSKNETLFSNIFASKIKLFFYLKKNTQKILKITIFNFAISLALIFIFLISFESYLKKTNIRKTNLPKELIGKKLLEGKVFKHLLLDGSPSTSIFDPFLKINYHHDLFGFRIKSNEKKFINNLNFNNSLIVVGDSTSYGLNINFEDTYGNRLYKKLLLKKLVNISFPSIDINGINSKLNCLDNLLTSKSEYPNTIILGLFHNDLQYRGLLNLKLEKLKCVDATNLNFLNMPILLDDTLDIKKLEIDRLKLNNPFYYTFYIGKKSVNKIVYLFSKNFPYSINQIKKALFKLYKNNSTYLLKKFFPEEYIFSTSLYSGINLNQKLKLSLQYQKLKINLKNLEKRTKNLIILYVPLNEKDILSTSKNIDNILAPRSYHFFRKICNDSLIKNLECMNGSLIIFDDLNNEEKNILKKDANLPEKYYSDLTNNDLAHPSAYTSELYAEKAFEIINSQ